MLTYLLCGEDITAKDAKIAELKTKFLNSPEALRFDYELLFAHKLDPKTLKEVLISLPAVASKRLIVIKECHRLNPHNKNLILDFVPKKADYAILILDTDLVDAKDSFLQKLKPSVKWAEFSKGEQVNVFDLTRFISMNRSMESLKILNKLLSQGEHPLQIMAGLVWYWRKTRDRISSCDFQKGLLALQETDLNIKRSRLDPVHALELLVVKLSSKEAC